jgi:hypothetical protein
MNSAIETLENQLRILQARLDYYKYRDFIERIASIQLEINEHESAIHILKQLYNK